MQPIIANLHYSQGEWRMLLGIPRRPDNWHFRRGNHYFIDAMQHAKENQIAD